MAVRTCGAADKHRDGVYQDFLNMNTRLSFRDYQHCMRHRDLLHGDNASLTPEEWSDRYQKYKTDYQRQSLWSFFLRHQSDEWFKEKYAIYAPYVEARRLRRIARTGERGEGGCISETVRLRGLCPGPVVFIHGERFEVCVGVWL